MADALFNVFCADQSKKPSGAIRASEVRHNFIPGLTGFAKSKRRRRKDFSAENAGN
jgi:hypothetical protein